ncbi:hypothetical protein DPEC_G00252230 [Dallia pectoralis]|uniref:Uncharacterized protein n=1 Tax=Dallia pectoralis TaxID=75939 RepID=A0ACC2FTN5_DALPE|nr:hypothetical protein DPEC_G00252230 [Dallia pectoralis]
MSQQKWELSSQLPTTTAGTGVGSVTSLWNETASPSVDWSDGKNPPALTRRLPLVFKKVGRHSQGKRIRSPDRPSPRRRAVSAKPSPGARPTSPSQTENPARTPCAEHALPRESATPPTNEDGRLGFYGPYKRTPNLALFSGVGEQEAGGVEMR